ncbi:MAG: PEGA domain-containing protein [Patescibacteria group bacterium]|nr:PEGA domain-containing protein [Patescibacteria group bacterium]
MTLKVRRILSFIFIVLFLSITPLIMLYAAGYRLGKNGFSVQRTGMFIIDSKPEGAKIFIDNKPQETWASSILNKKNYITTPAKIKNLLPGEYDLRLELDGYWSWQKKLTVNPGASTFAENIYLFKNDLPIQIMPSDIESTKLPDDNNQAIILSSDLITFLNLSEESRKTVKRNGLAGKNISWSEDQNKIIIDNYLYDLTDLNSAVDLKKITPNSFNYKWVGNNLYYQDKNSVYRLEAANLPKKIIGNKIFNDYLIKNNYLYLIAKSGSAVNLETIDAATGQSLKNINLPAALNYSFINTEQNLLNLYDGGHKILYLIDPLSAYQPLVEIINNVKTTFWTDSDNLLYANDFEIWLYNLPNKNRTLITRISETIGNAILHPSKDYIIYSTKQTINAIELDEREKRNITELIKFDSINSFGLTEDIIYFSGKIGNSEGLYKYLIQ